MKSLVRGLVPGMVLGVAVLSAGVAMAFAGSGVCKATAKAALASCRLGAGDDYALATGKCLNIGDSSARDACNAEALDEKRSAPGDCNDQYAARLDACDRLGGGIYDPAIDPNDFTTVIDNPWFPLTPGTTYVYHTQTAGGLEEDVFTVTHDTRKIMGVTCVVVHDTVSLDGVPVEETLDYHAQDKDGNVWYFGENSQELEDGLVVSLEGSWLAGVDGAKPGIVMKANPAAGDVYRQEFDLGNAEDMAAVVSLDASASVPYGSFSHALETDEFTPVEPDADEHKVYVAGIGTVLEVDQVTGDRTELISVTP